MNEHGCFTWGLQRNGTERQKKLFSWHLPGAVTTRKVKNMNIDNKIHDSNPPLYSKGK